MTIAEKLTLITENSKALSAQGYNQGVKDTWDEFTNDNTRGAYAQAFAQSKYEYIRPPYTLQPTAVDTGNQTFAGAKFLKKVEKQFFDFTNKKKGTYASVAWYWTFANCSALEEIEDIGLNADYSYTNTFIRCKALHTIAVLRPDSNTRWDNAFNECSALQNLTIDGVIGQNGFNVQWSPLTHASLMSIINALADKTTDTSGTEWILTIGGTNKAKLTAEELKIAEDKGWTIS